MQIERIALIGCGGVGGQMAASLDTFTDPLNVIAVDGDNYEAANQDRQPLALAYPGANKANAFRSEFGFTPMPEFLNRGNIGKLKDFKPDLIISAVDNDEARITIWKNFNGKIPILWGANEIWSPQAGISLPEKPWVPWEWMPKRPPSDNRCGIQTVFANKMAANLAMALLSVHCDAPGNELNPIFMAHEHGEPLLTISMKEL